MNSPSSLKTWSGMWSRMGETVEAQGHLQKSRVARAPAVLFGSNLNCCLPKYSENCFGSNERQGFSIGTLHRQGESSQPEFCLAAKHQSLCSSFEV